MKGSNKLTLNAATVCEAMQEYLDRSMGFRAPLVKSATFDYVTGNTTFYVEEKPKPKTA